MYTTAAATTTTTTITTLISNNNNNNNNNNRQSTKIPKRFQNMQILKWKYSACGSNKQKWYR